MQANDVLEYRSKIIKAFKDGTFLSEHLKKSDAAAYNYVLKDVNNFIEEIKWMEEKINLSLFEDFFQSSSPVDYPKKLINIKSPDESRGIVEEIKDRISDLEDKIEQMNEKEKKNVKETEIIRKILDYNKNAQNIFHRASKVDKKIKIKI